MTHSPNLPRIWLALLLAIAASPIPALARDVKIPSPPDGSGRKIVVRNTIVLKRPGKTYDYKGATLVWKGRGDCSQREAMPPMFVIRAKGVTLKNAILINPPDGIHITAPDATIENIVFPDVCEDAITFDRGARNATVRNCYFADASDKAIQGNSGAGHRIHDNTFVAVLQPFRSSRGVRAEFFNNRLYHCRYAVHASDPGSKTTVHDNTFYKVETPYRSQKKASISEKGGDETLE